MLRSIKEASETAADADMFYSKDILKGWAFNRRFIMSDGTIETHPLKGNPHIISPEGPNSKYLHMLWAKNKGGKIIGGMIVFGCHATVMERNNKLISSDFPGKCTEYLDKKIGAPFLYFQSACGNICQVNPLAEANHEVGREWAVKMGVAIGDKVMANISKEGIPSGATSDIKSEILKIPRRKIPAELLQWANSCKKIAADIPDLSNYGAENYNHLPGGIFSLEAIFKSPFWANFYADEIKTRERDYNREPEMPFNIKVMTFGEKLAVIALPCELFIEWQNKIIQESPFPNTIVIELANGWNGYIPTLESFSRQGGYETKEVSSTMLIPEAGNIIEDAVVNMLKSNWKGY